VMQPNSVSRDLLEHLPVLQHLESTPFNKVMEFQYETEEDELPLMQVMNYIAFDQGEKGRKFDANFISILNPERKEFEYFIQRLAGKEMENERQPYLGKMWVPYINSKREDWSYICENNRIIAKEDEIIFRFEEPY
jgi:hypothetical protein